MAIVNLSYTTVEFADQLLTNYGHTMLSTWVSLEEEQKQQMLNMAALQLKIGYCLPECLMSLDPIPLLLQQANVWVMADVYGSSMQQLLNGATSIRVDVLQITRQAVLANQNLNPFSDIVDKLMGQLGFDYCGRRGNMFIKPRGSRG